MSRGARLWWCIAAAAGMAESRAQTAPALPPPADLAPAAFARFVPERADDFAWENDQIAFRAFGPKLRPGAEDSGFDVWLKRVPYPIIDRWYAGNARGLSYHQDHGEGYDPYHVGSSRGTGGLGLWVEDRLVISDTFVAWRILEQSRERVVFELDYTYPAAEGAAPVTEVKRITIGLGEPFFLAESRFAREGRPLAGQPVAIGVSTQNGRGQATLRPAARWIAVWDKIDGDGLGTGAVLAAGFPVETREIRSAEKDTSHALLITQTDAAGVVRYHVGYGWQRAGRFTTAESWFAALDARAAKP